MSPVSGSSAPHPGETLRSGSFRDSGSQALPLSPRSCRVWAPLCLRAVWTDGVEVARGGLEGPRAHSVARAQVSGHGVPSCAVEEEPASLVDGDGLCREAAI